MFYISYLANDADYQGVLLNKYRLKKFGSTVPHACIVLNDVSDEVRSALSRDGITLLPMDFSNILSSTSLDAQMNDYLSSNFVFGKLLILLITGVEKCVFLDADFLICENLDYLFSLSFDGTNMHMVRDHYLCGTRSVLYTENAFNSGLIVFQPDQELFNQCLDLLIKIQAYPDIFSKLKTDQEIFNLLNQEGSITIHSLPYRLNAYPHTAQVLLNSEIEDSIAVYHFIGRPKPWDLLKGLVPQRGFENQSALDQNAVWLDAYLDYCKHTYLGEGLLNGALEEGASAILISKDEGHIAMNLTFNGHSSEELARAQELKVISLEPSLTDVQHRIIDTLASVDDVFVVQVGSNDGQQGDPLFDLVHQFERWRGMFVEPVDFLFERLKKNYANSQRFIFENKALDSQAGELEFFYVSESAKDELDVLPYWYDQLGSFNREHIVKHLDGLLEPYIVSKKVKCDTLMNLLEIHAIKKVDLLHIDTEGHDYQIISSIDFDSCRPTLILYEHVHLSGKEKKAAEELLTANGYKSREFGNDTLATLIGQS